MRDEITRATETDAVLRLLAHLTGRGDATRVLDAGCGNGYLLAAVHTRFPELVLTGLDLSPEMVALATQRGIESCTVTQGDVLRMPFQDESFDLVVSERCIINLAGRGEQAVALAEIARVLRTGGHYICIEAFTDGLEELNRARAELGLPPNAAPEFNVWLDKTWFYDTIRNVLVETDAASHGDSLPAANLLSSHYFVSRVLYPAITREEVVYNAELVRFFSFLPPIGNYSPIQLFLLEKNARAVS